MHPALGAPDSHFSCRLHGVASTHTHWRIPRAPSAPGPHASAGQMCSSRHPESRGKIAIEEQKTGDFSFSWDCPQEKLPRRCGVRAEVGVFVLEKGQQLIGRSQSSSVQLRDSRETWMPEESRGHCQLTGYRALQREVALIPAIRCCEQNTCIQSVNKHLVSKHYVLSTVGSKSEHPSQVCRPGRAYNLMGQTHSEQGTREYQAHHKWCERAETGGSRGTSLGQVAWDSVSRALRGVSALAGPELLVGASRNL